MVFRHPPITEGGFVGVEEFIEWRMRKLLVGQEGTLASALLFHDIPQGAILGGEPVQTHLGVGAAVTVRKRQTLATRTHPHVPATPRIMNLEFFAILRMLLSAGDTTYLDTSARAAAPPEDHHFYGEVIGRYGITWLRLIANAAPGQVVNEPPVHTFLFREMLSHDTVQARRAEGKRSQGSYRGRAIAVDAACENLEKELRHGRMSFDLTEDRLRLRLGQAFDLLDQHELGSALPGGKLIAREEKPPEHSLV